MDIARYIDHTLLKADATPAQIERLCAEAREYSFAAVCVNPLYVALAARLLAGSDSAVCTVAGFPLGTTTTEVKVFETQQAIQNGASEVDMVLAIGLLKAGELDAVREDIRRIAETCHAANAICKVIIETALLSDDEKVAASQLVVEAGADFVKTSTGFSTAGATLADVALMKRTVGERARIKAAGGVRTLADAVAMIEAGVSRIGTSGGVALVQAARGEAGSVSGGGY